MASPWLKFYPTDWQSDPALRVCSLAARGLWAEMLFIMHKAEPYGFLVINGKPVTPKQLAVLVGAPQRDVEAYLKELEDNGVPSRDEHGTIYSRRMVRDAAKAEKDKTNGKSGGNPRLKRNGEVNPKPPDKPKRGLTPPLTPTGVGEDKAQSQKPESDSGESHQHPPETEAAPARGQSLVSPEAVSLADEIGESIGFTKENWPPGWCGAAMAIQKWLNDGCPAEVVKLAVTTSLRRKRDGPPDNFSYFAKPIASAFADHKRPNPTAQPQAFEDRTNGHASRKRTIIDAADDLVAKLNGLRGEAEIGGGQGAAPIRLLPPK
jgi:hypothetical protein